MDAEDTVRLLLRDGFILVFNQDALDVVRTAEALLQAGLNNMEVTCRISQPLGKIARLKKAFPDFGAGAASLVDFQSMREAYNRARPEDPLPGADEAVDAGADYVVSAANFTDTTYRRLRGKVATMPGCGTVSEIVDQFSRGANFCKIFPAKQIGGPAFIKAVDPALHRTISLVPTGGTNAGNIPEYIAAEVLIVGGSFSLIDKTILAKIINDQDYGLLAAEMRRVKELIDQCRADKWPGLDFATASVADITHATGRLFNVT